MRFVKGHGTENDFVLLPDPDDELTLSPQTVRALCDRRRGVGGDGVLRVVRGAAGSGAEWFMDYRNADGSLAEMCGNGIRVLARYLVDSGLAQPGPLAVGTRSGVRRLDVPASGDITVDMGQWAPIEGLRTVRVGGHSWPARALSLGNPHAVVRVEDLADAGPLSAPPAVEPEFPGGLNVEFVVPAGPQHLRMRVHERGSGETRSCGTGACAVAVAAALDAGTAAEGAAFTVDVPGGRLAVEVGADRTVRLRGPAVLVASGEVDLAALGAG